MSEGLGSGSGPKPIVVVGLPRTGTTWMAGAITVGVGGPYLHEPFNAALDQRHRRWALQLLDDDGLDRFEVAYDGAWTAVGAGPGPVVKDVHALFALAALARRRNLPAVVAVRHPCAMANSHHELGWTDTGLELLLAQPRLVGRGGPLGPWAGHLERCRHDLDAAFGATWGAVLTVLDGLLGARGAHLVHEAMCRAPAVEAVAALDRIGVALSPAGGRPALDAWVAAHDHDSADRTSQFRRSGDQPDRWRRAFDPDRAARVLAGAEPFDQLERYFG